MPRGGSDIPTVSSPSPNSGPVGSLLESAEAAGLIPDSEEAVQVGISNKHRMPDFVSYCKLLSGRAAVVTKF